MPAENIYGRPNVENVVFNFDDIITGRTYIPFYAYGHQSPTIGYALTRQIVEASPQDVKDETSFDQDFDILVNKPITIEGDVLIQFTFGSTGGGTGAVQTYNMEFILRKWDGTTETDIGTANGGTSGQTGDFSSRRLFKFAVNKTTFKVGETIRLTAIGTGGLTNRLVFLNTDPGDVDDNCIMYLPTLTQG